MDGPNVNLDVLKQYYQYRFEKEHLMLVNMVVVVSTYFMEPCSMALNSQVGILIKLFHQSSIYFVTKDIFI